MPSRFRGARLPALAAAPPLVAAEEIARPDPELARELVDQRIDPARLIVELYEARLLPRHARRASGVYYTPRWIIEAMLDRLPVRGEWLDPSAGAGAFLVEIVRRHGRAALSWLSACDVDPHALDAAAFALEALLGRDAREDVAAWRRNRAHGIDFLRREWPGARPDVIIGNPPYGLSAEPDLPALFSELRGEIDLYACFLLQASKVAVPGGRVSLLVPDTWLTNARAAALRGLLAEHGLARIVDFGKPFTTAPDTRVHAVSLRAGAETCEVESVRRDVLTPMASSTAGDLRKQARTGWRLYRTPGEVAACRKLERASRLDARFKVLYGLRTGDNARHIAEGPGLVPLIAGRDFDAFDRHPTARHLKNVAPFQSTLSRQRGRWKIGIQRIRTNSQLSWRRWVEAALLQPDEVGLDSLTLVADPLLDQGAPDPSAALLGLLGVLSSSVLNRWYRLTFTDVNVKPAYVTAIPVPALDADIAALVQRRLASPGAQALERAIDRLVAVAYELTEDELESLEAEFWGPDRPKLPSLDEARWMARRTEDAPLQRKGG
jgi:hypothetical protein